jgi:mRNA interferase MazF
MDGVDGHTGERRLGSGLQPPGRRGTRAAWGALLMRRGEIRMIELQVGPRAVRRPAVIVSNDGANETARRLGRGVITVVPVAPRAGPIYPFQTLLPAAFTGLPEDGKAHADQIRWIDVADVGERVGVIPPGIVMMLNDALRLHLSL